MTENKKAREDKWLLDVGRYADTIPYGTVQLTIIRAANKTVQVQTDSVETIRYENNDEAKKELEKIIDSLVSSGFDGTLTVSVQFKGGKIKEAGFYNLKQTRYKN